MDSLASISGQWGLDPPPSTFDQWPPPVMNGSVFGTPNPPLSYTGNTEQHPTPVIHWQQATQMAPRPLPFTPPKSHQSTPHRQSGDWSQRLQNLSPHHTAPTLLAQPEFLTSSVNFNVNDSSLHLSSPRPLPPALSFSPKPVIHVVPLAPTSTASLDDPQLTNRLSAENEWQRVLHTAEQEAAADLTSTHRMAIHTLDTHVAQLTETLRQRDERIAELIATVEAVTQTGKQKVEAAEAAGKEALRNREALAVAELLKQEQIHKEAMLLAEESLANRRKELEAEIAERERNIQLTIEMRVEAAERKLRAKYKQRITAITTEVEASLAQFRERELVTLGRMEEARREIVHLAASAEAKEKLHREELLLKDKRLLEIQRRWELLEDVEQQAKHWRNVTEELSSMIIRLSGSADNLPSLPGSTSSINEGNLTGLYASLGFDTTAQQLLIQQTQKYEKCAKENVMVPKSHLSKVFKYCKSIQERISSSEKHLPS